MKNSGWQVLAGLSSLKTERSFCPLKVLISHQSIISPSAKPSAPVPRSHILFVQRPVIIVIEQSTCTSDICADAAGRKCYFIVFRKPGCLACTTRSWPHAARSQKGLSVSTSGSGVVQLHAMPIWRRPWLTTGTGWSLGRNRLSTRRICLNCSISICSNVSNRRR